MYVANERSQLLIIKRKAHRSYSRPILYVIFVILLCIAILCCTIFIIKERRKTRCNQDTINAISAQLEYTESELKNAERGQDELRRQLEEEQQKNNELASQVNELNEKVSKRSKQQNIVATGVSSFKSYMDYRTITSKGSAAYKLQQQAVTDVNGLRKIDDYYCVAMGSRYGKVGDTFYIETDEGAHWNVILADIKSDKHTDSTHSYTLSNGCMMEFIVDTRTLPSTIKRSGTVNGLGFQGNITIIKQI